MKNEFCEIFRTGTHTDSKGTSRNWTTDDLEKICENFESKNPDVPICCGHPKTNSPAYGWIEKLKVEGNKLYASFKDVQPEFKEAVKKGLFKTRSISLTKDLIPRHIAFLGAQAPAIKGMEAFCFSEAIQDDINIEFSEANDSDNNENGKSVITDPGEAAGTSASLLNNEGENMSEELQRQLTSTNEELVTTKQELEKLRQEVLRKDFADFCDSAIKDGNILPAQRGDVLNLLFANTDTNINFDDGGTKPSNEVFKDFIKSLHQMDFQDTTNEDNLDDSQNQDFSEFQASDWEAAIQEEIAKAEQKGQSISTKEALNRVKRKV